MKKKNILVIPHTFQDNIKVREYEIAKELTKQFKVHYIKGLTLSNPRSLISKVVFFIKSILSRLQLTKKDNLTLIRPPLLYAPLTLGGLALKANAQILKHVIKKFDIDIVLNASFYWLPVEKKRTFIYVYDLVDDTFDNPTLMAFSAAEMHKADIVITITELLKKKIQARIPLLNKPIAIIPNGTNIKKFNINAKRITELKRKYDLQDPIIIGYIGYFEEWGGLDFALKVLAQLNKRGDAPKYKLLLVGGGPGLAKIKKLPEYVEYIGYIDPRNIAEYFKMIDIGILPFQITELTNNAFPLKIIEYGAARKLVVATPLRILKEKKFPNVVLADYNNIIEWERAIKKALMNKWKSHWDKSYNEYDWTALVQKLIEKIKRLLQ